MFWVLLLDGCSCSCYKRRRTWPAWAGIPSVFHSNGIRRRILIALNMDLVVQDVLKHVEQQNLVRSGPAFDLEQPIGSTRPLRTWHLSKGNRPS
jgi:type III restriction enzyme